MDDYESEITSAEARILDEKENWNQIAAEDLNACHSSLSFFDAEGMRFHLPAYLVADLRKQLGCNPIFHLTKLDDYALGKLILLSAEQRAVIRRYLLFVKDLPNYQFERPAIERALAGYWKEDLEMG